MSKARIYELAKELNTTSKRLMEKLAEINIDVKNHMSLLEERELDALYKHIGVIKHDDNKNTDSEEKKHIPPMPPKLAEAKKDSKNAPRIIRKTEIFLDSKDDNKEAKASSRFDNTRNSDNNRNDYKYDNRTSNRGNQNQGYVRTVESTSGLRPGYIRDTGPAIKRDNRPNAKNVSHKDVHKAESAGDEAKVINQKEAVVSKPPALQADKGKEEKQADKALNNESLERKTEQVQKQDTKEAPKEIKEKVGKEIENMKNSSVKTVETVKSEEETKLEKEVDVRSDMPKHQHGERPQSAGYNRQGDRPQGGGYNRPQGDRAQGGGYNRPQGDRAQGGGYNRPQGDRPQGGGYNRPQGDRPQGGGYNRPQGDRPQGGGYNRPQGDRPQGGGYNRPQGDRPQGGGFNRQGDRPQGGGFNRQGDRPQGGGFNRQGDRPQGGGFNRQGGRPQGGGFNRQGDRPQGGFRSASKPLEIPKPEFTAAHKEEMNSQRSETRREFQNKEVEKDVKREQKRDVTKGTTQGKEKRFKPQSIVLSQKKGVSEVLDEEFILDEFYGDDGVKTKKSSRPRKNDKASAGNRHIPHKAVLVSITIPESITVKDLAEALKKTSTEIIKKLMGLGVMAALNQEVDFDTATLIADEFGVKVEKQVVVNEEDILFDDEEDIEGELVPRPPVVVVMGHVDHGKTSLLDAIREANVMDTEAGGITQHIGAYMVKIHDRNITFLDTPGHEAFTAMRARGAQVTDIAILVVAADDGVMPQTVEAINHAKAANVSIIVAINKIDKPGANPDRVKQELTEHGIVAEEWGGDAIMVPVSAKKRENIDQLLEMVTLTADILELKANPNKQAKGTIIEAKLDKARGPVATVLVQRGTLNTGDSVVTGTTVGRIRAMTDDKGHKVKKAGPSTPVEILGLPEVPEAGEIFYAITDEKVARQLADKRKLKLREKQLKASAKVSLEDLYNQIKEGKVKDLNIIVKADVQGSVEAVKQSLEKLSNEEVRIRIIHGGVGAINEADVTLASISNAIIIGFNVRPGANVTEAAENSGVDMRLYRVIYNAIEDVQAAMNGMLEPTFKEVVLGHAEVRQIFKVSNVGTIGGCYVTDGKIARNSEVRIVRDGIVVHEGKLDSLKRFKDDVKEVSQGYECGLQIERYNDIKEGDVVEAFIMEEVKR